MEMLKKVADRHGLVCLLHEKPFAGVNGCGKHDNWSLATGHRREPAQARRHPPSQNAQFLLFLAAFIKGVDEYQEIAALLRVLSRQRPPAGRQRGPSRHHLHLPG